MINMLPSVIAPWTPLLWVVAACLCWWRAIPRPWLFATSALFALLGLYAVFSTIVEYVSLVKGAAIVGAPTEGGLQEYFEAQNRAAIITAALVAVIAGPYLFWLKKGLSQ